MKSAVIIISLLAIILASVACRYSGRSVSKSSKFDDGPLVVIGKGAQPSLKTNEVLQISDEAASENGLSLESYVCRMISFGVNSTNMVGTNKWFVFFTREQWTRHDSFAFYIDDKSREVELVRPGVGPKIRPP